jgi:small subunit ribosomal protein S4e
LRGNEGAPFAVTHDGRSIRYPEPEIKAHDCLILDTTTQKILDFIKFEIGNISIITNGNNAGRIGLISHQEKHPGSNTIVTIRDSSGKDFSTPKENVFVIGKGIKPMVSLPVGG